MSRPSDPQVDDGGQVVQQHRPFFFVNEVPVEGFDWQYGHSPLAPAATQMQLEADDDAGTDLGRLSPVPGWALVAPQRVIGRRGRGALRVEQMHDHEVRPTEDNHVLFRQFADLDPEDRAALLAFANRYGRLTIGEPFFPLERPAELTSHLPPVTRVELEEYATGRRSRADVGLSRIAFPKLWVGAAETHDFWKEAILEIRLAVRVWEAIERPDSEDLSDLFVIRPIAQGKANGWHIRGNAGDLRFVGSTTRSASPRDDERRAVARRWLHCEINPHLWRMVNPQIGISTTTGRPEISLLPSDLLTALWVQFAEAVAGNKEYRQCCCRRWFEVPVSTDGRSKRRTHCSDACKSRAYRERTATTPEPAKPPKRKRKST